MTFQFIMFYHLIFMSLYLDNDSSTFHSNFIHVCFILPLFVFTFDKVLFVTLNKTKCPLWG